MDQLVDMKIIKICYVPIEELEGEEHGVPTKDEATGQDEGMKHLENKLEKMMWKMNIVVVCIAIVVLAAVVKSVVKN